MAKYQKTIRRKERLLSFLSRTCSFSYWKPRRCVVFCLYIFVRFIAALFLSISDCDETFNYWEPLHYLLHGFGFQTWEYSPQFRLRSYAYLWIYGLVGKLFSLLATNKVGQFFFIRTVVGIFDAMSETFLYSSILKKYGAATSSLFFIFSLLSPGLFISTTSILPSSFSLILFNFALSYWIDGNWFRAVIILSIASLWGWPFVAVLGIPLALYVMSLKGLGYFFKMVISLAIWNLLPLFIIDSYFYGKPTIAPFNLFLYNVFPTKGKGSELFGVEPWYYYLLNLFLNFNVIILFPFIVLPVLFVMFPFSKGDKTSFVWNNKRQWLDSLCYCSPLYLWSMIFLFQPHKEERFFFPIYQVICISSAICLSCLQRVLQHLEHWLKDMQFFSRFYSRKSKLFISEGLVTCFLLLFIFLSLGRITILIRGYQAPLSVYREFSKREKDAYLSREYNICIGKEWYRFMSHFFIPQRHFRVRWIPCGFDGILPRYFDESGMPNGKYLIPLLFMNLIYPKGTRKIPVGMNDENRAVPEQFFYSLNECDYYVDYESLVNPPNELTNGLCPVISKSFLDSQVTPRSIRVFYIPFISSRASYGRYVLYELSWMKRTN